MDILLGQYKGLEATIPVINYTEEDVQNQLHALLSGNPVKESKKGPVANGDTAVIDYEGFKDDVPFDGGKAEKYPLVIGSGSFIPGFEEQIIGMNIGEERDINLSFPEQYHAKDLAGKAVVFKIKLHDIYTEKPAELNDDFAASLEIPGVKTVDDLKKHIVEYLEYQVQSKRDDATREQVYDKLLENSSCLLTPEAINSAIELQLQQMAAQLAQQGIQLEQYVQMMGKTLDSLREEIKPFATKQAKLEAILDEIIKVEKVEVSDDEIDEQYSLISERYGQPLEVVKQVMPKASLKSDLLHMKASQIIIDSAIVKTEV